MKKIKVKTLYLIAIVVGGLIGLATKSTYALFTSSAEIDNPICMATNLTSEDEVVDTIDVTIASGEFKEVPITINNTSSSLLNYMVFYNPTSSDIVIGVNMKNTDSSNSSGTIKTGETKKVYVQIKNNSSSSITITLGVVSNSISSDMNMVPSGKDGESTITIGTNLAEYITSLYTNATKTPVTNNGVTYNYATSVGLMNDRLASSSTEIDNGNIRYYGASPNNYIYFNCSDYSNQTSSTCETWRIIGVFNGKLKLIRNESIGNYSWDNKNTSTGAESNYGKNDWTTARLMKLLNPSDYYKVDSNDNNLGQSLYYNSASGKCYSGKNNTTVNCDFTSTGIKDTTRNMIAETTWNIGGWNSNSVYPNQMYGYERGTLRYNTDRPLYWEGMVGLMYPSDYGYAAGNSCVTGTELYDYKGGCRNKDWLYISNTYQWLMSPYSGDSGDAFYVYSSGYVRYGDVHDAYSARPVFYLNSSASISEGEGTSAAPYILS